MIRVRVTLASLVFLQGPVRPLLAAGELWLDERCKLLPSDLLGPFIKLDDENVLAIDSAATFVSSDGGQTWSDPRPLFGDGQKITVSAEDSRRGRHCCVHESAGAPLDVEERTARRSGREAADIRNAQSRRRADVAGPAENARRLERRRSGYDSNDRRPRDLHGDEDAARSGSALRADVFIDR